MTMVWKWSPRSTVSLAQAPACLANSCGKTCVDEAARGTRMTEKLASTAEKPVTLADQREFLYCVFHGSRDIARMSGHEC